MKKNKKLAVQVSLIVTLAFILALGLIGTIVVQGTRKMYIESQNGQIEQDMEECKALFMDPEIAGWVLDQWQSDPEMLEEPDTEADKAMMKDLEYTDSVARYVTRDTVDALMTPQTRRAFVKAMYRYLVNWFNRQRANGRFDSVFIVDIRNDDELYDQDRDDIYVIMECSEDTDNSGDHCLGDYWSKDEAFNVIDTLHNGVHGEDYGDILYEQLEDTEYDQLMYLAVAPVFVENTLRYVVCLEYDWPAFAHILNVNLRSMALWGGVSLLLTNALLVVFIYFRAVRPMVQVNDGIRAYMETKDGSAAANSMAKIRERNEVGKLAESIAYMAVEIDRYTAENLRINAEREHLNAELDLAASIQSGQLPSKFPAFPDRGEFDIYASMTPAKTVGGDFYDFFLVDDDHIALVMADVSGKGVPAALFMMVSRILIKNHLQAGESPAAALTSVNKQLLENNQKGLFVTVWLAVVELSTGRGVAANAGHEHPALRRAGGQYELVEYKHASPVGILKRSKFTEHEFELHPGDSLFIYTDGVAEATDRNETLFGTDRMLAALNREPDAACARVLQNVMDDIRAFVDDAEQFDDITMLCFRYHGGARQSD